MSVPMVQMLGDAGAMWRRDRDLLIRVSCVFFFLPALALALFLPDPAPVAEGAADGDRLQALIAYAQRTLHWTVAAQLIGMIGSIALYAAYLGPRRPIGEALRAAVPMLPLFAIAMLLAFMMFIGGFLLFVLPGMYIAGRLFVAGPAMIAEGRRDPIAVLARAMALSRGHGWLLFLLLALVMLSGWIVASVVGGVASGLTAAAGAGAAQLVTAPLIAAVSMATSLALTLLRIAAYRVLSGTDPFSTGPSSTGI